MSVEITDRGVIGELYQAARAIEEGPLCLEAAVRRFQRAQKGTVVSLATGLPTYPWFVDEQDGPAGTATLARPWSLGWGLGR